MEKEKIIHMTVRIDEEFYTQVKIMAIQNKTPKISKLVRALLKLFLEDQTIREKIKSIYNQIK